MAEQAEYGYGSKNPAVGALLRARGATINDYFEYYASEDGGSEWDSDEQESLVSVVYDKATGEYDTMYMGRGFCHRFSR